MKKFFDCPTVSSDNPFVHECSANFRSLFSPFLFAEKCEFFVILNTFIAFRSKILSGG